MLRIQKLVLHKFPHVAPGTVLEFGPGLNVLLGKNGTGKTTLLKLLTRVAALDFEGLEEEGDYKLECHVDYGTVTLELHVESSRAVPVEPYPDDSDRAMDEMVGRYGQRWHYRGRLVSGENYEIARFLNGSNSASETVPATKPRPDRQLPGLGAELPAGLWQYFYLAEAVAGEEADAVAAAHSALFTLYLACDDARTGRFDEALVAYDSFSGARPSSDSRAPGAASLGRYLNRGTPFSLKAFVPAVLERILGTEDFATAAKSASVSLRGMPALANYLDTAGFLAATIELDKPEESGNDQWRRRNYTNFKLRVTLDPQTTIYSNRLSFGQKRLFAFYWYLACIPEGVVLADELVNGFHHDWIAACLDQIGERQAILASQNPLLLDFLTFDDAEQVRRSFVLCNLEDKEGGGRQWNWQNMTSDRAEEFFRAYEVGLQHVSEILRVGGWW